MTDTDGGIREMVKGAGVVYAGLIAEMFVAFLAQLLAARYLSVSDFGGITTGVALLNIGAVLGSLGLGYGMTRYFPRVEKKKRGAVARASYLLSVPVSLILGVLVVLNAEFIASSIFGDPAVSLSISVFGAAIPFAATLRVTIGAIRGQKVSRYRVYIENFTRPVVRFTLILATVLFGLGQIGVAGAYAASYVVGVLLAIYLLVRNLPEITSGWSLETTLSREVLGYSLPFVITGTTGFIYRSIDIFLILYFLDSASVGVYGVAYAAARLILMFSTAFNFLSSPVSSEVESEGGIRATVEMNRSLLRWLVILSVPAMVPLLFFPAEFISTVYRPRYAEGAVVLSVLVIGFAVHNAVSIQGSILEALGKSRLPAVNNMICATVNVGANLVLIPRFGIEGAAVATVLSYLLMDFLLSMEVWYLTETALITRKVLAPVGISIPLLGLTWAISSHIPGTLPWLILLGATFGVVFILATVLLSGVEPEELMLLRSAEERFGIDLGPILRFAEAFERENHST